MDQTYTKKCQKCDALWAVETMDGARTICLTHGDDKIESLIKDFIPAEIIPLLDKAMEDMMVLIHEE